MGNFLAPKQSHPAKALHVNLSSFPTHKHVVFGSVIHQVVLTTRFTYSISCISPQVLGPRLCFHCFSVCCLCCNTAFSPTVSCRMWTLGHQCDLQFPQMWWGLVSISAFCTYEIIQWWLVKGYSAKAFMSSLEALCYQINCTLIKCLDWHFPVYKNWLLLFESSYLTNVLNIK